MSIIIGRAGRGGCRRRWRTARVDVRRRSPPGTSTRPPGRYGWPASAGTRPRALAAGVKLPSARSRPGFSHRDPPHYGGRYAVSQHHRRRYHTGARPAPPTCIPRCSVPADQRSASSTTAGCRCEYLPSKAIVVQITGALRRRGFGAMVRHRDHGIPPGTQRRRPRASPEPPRFAIICQ